MAVTKRGAGQTDFGSARVAGAAATGVTPASGGCSLAVNTAPSSASAIILVDTAGVEWVIWVSVAGKLTIGTRTNWTTPDSAGTVVGSQS